VFNVNLDKQKITKHTIYTLEQGKIFEK